MPKITGIVKVYVNGQLQRSKDGAELDIGGMERELHTGHSVYGYTEKVVPSNVQFTLVHMADTDIVAIGELVGATVRFETDVGKVFTIANACTLKTLKLKGGDGEVAVEMGGPPAVAE